jgi:hypothetical protein
VKKENKKEKTTEFRNENQERLYPDDLQKPPVAGDKVKTIDGTIVGKYSK